MIEDVDFTGVDPLRREETKRRLLIIKEYLAIDKPTKEDTERFAQMIGVRKNQFYTIVRAWVVNGRAVALPGAFHRAARFGSRLDSMIDERTEAMVEEAIDLLGASASYAAITREAARRCELEGLAPPSHNAVQPRVEKRRKKERGRPIHTTDIYVGRCATDLPVLLDGGTLAPAVIAFAVQASSRRIVACAFGHGRRPGSIADAIVAAMRAGRQDGERSMLRIDIGRGEEHRALERAVRACGMDGTATFGPTKAVDPRIQVLLGGRLGAIRLTAFRMQAEWKMGVRTNGTRKRIASETEAEAYVNEMVSTHNGALPHVADGRGYRLGDIASADILERVNRHLLG